MALIQGIYVQNFPSNLNPMRMSIVVARHNSGLFNVHPNRYETRFYERVYDSGEYDIIWRKKIYALDIEGNKVSGRVIHQCRGNARIDIDPESEFVVVES